MLLNDAIRTVGAKLAKAERRLAAEPTNINRLKARDALAITLEGLFAQARDGRVYEFNDRNPRPRLKAKGEWNGANGSCRTFDIGTPKD